MCIWFDMTIAYLRYRYGSISDQTRALCNTFSLDGSLFSAQNEMFVTVAFWKLQV